MRALSESTLKKAAQALVLGTFAALLALGRLEFWAVAFGLGLAIEAIKPGRLYCMWLCPIRAAHGLADRGSVARRRRTASLFRTRTFKALGWAFIAIFLVLFGIFLALGLRGWLFPAFVGIGVILSFELSLLTLCSSFCPLGAAFVIVRRISGRISVFISAATPKRLCRPGRDPHRGSS
jgi:hypothetical protein